MSPGPKRSVRTTRKRSDCRSKKASSPEPGRIQLVTRCPRTSEHTTYLERSDALLDAFVIDAENNQVVPADLVDVFFVRHRQSATRKQVLVDRASRIARVVSPCDVELVVAVGDKP